MELIPQHEVRGIHMKRGMRAFDPESIKLKFSDYVVRAKLPAEPKGAFGHVVAASPPGGWGILGNNKHGDCVMAGCCHETMHWFWSTGKPIPQFTDDVALKQYYERTGGADTGLDPVATAAWRRNTGVTDADGVVHKVDAYVRVTDLDDLTLATYLFGATGMCWYLPKTAEQQFAQAHIWDDLSHPPDPNAGHYTSFVGRNKNGQYQFLTWGRVHGATRAYCEKYMVGAGCIAYLSRDYLLNSGKSPEAIAWGDLQADITAVVTA
jgi:hypothetical protein